MAIFITLPFICLMLIGVGIVEGFFDKKSSKRIESSKRIGGFGE